MKKFSMLAAFAAFSLGTSLSFADTVVTKDGSKLVGKITQLNGANIVLKTNAAGDVKIKTAEVVSLATDAPMNVRLGNGAVALGAASMGAPGTLVINTAQGPVTTGMDKVTQTWAAGAKDPELVKLEHHWNYEAGMDITGKAGNSEQFGTSLSFRATCKSSYDVLQLYTGYDRQVTDGAKSTDQGRLGADYQNNFSGRFSWYARDELGFNHIKAINLYNTAAAGLGYYVVKTKADSLTFRAGLAHRYEGYSTAGAGSLNALALDIGLINDLTMKTWSMHNLITYTPSVNDFTTYRFYHESYIQLPLASPRWKFRVGVSNDYHSPPPEGAAKGRRLDTTYFARLILTW